MADSLENTDVSETAGASVRPSNAGGVPKRQWHIAIVKQYTEEHCCKCVQELGYEAYVASQQETRVYANRHRRTISRIIIPSIVFIRVTEKERIKLLKTCPLIPAFLTNKAAKPNEFGRHPMAIIPDSQIATLQFMLYHADTPVSFTAVPIQQGDRIRVLRGPFAGFEGYVTQDDKKAELVVNINFLGSAKTSIPVEDIEKIA